MRFLFLVSTFLLVSFYSFTQDKAKIDSLNLKLANATHDTTKAKLLVELTEHIYLYNPDTVIPLCQKAIEIIDKNLPHANPQEEISFLHTKASALNNIGAIYYNQGEVEKALEYYFLSLNILEEVKDQKVIASSYNNIGLIYMNQGEIEKALEYYFLSLKLREEIKDKYGMAVSYNNIGFIYSKQGEFENALEYYFLSLELREEIKDTKGMANSYNNIGGIYDEQEELEKALGYYFLSLKIKEEIKDKRGVVTSYYNIGCVLCELDSLEAGMRYLELGLGIAKELSDKAEMAYANTAIGKWKFKMGNVNEALDIAHKALDLAKVVGYPGNIKIAARLLSDIYKKQGNFKDALKMYELEIEMRDSIVNEENTKATIRQQMKYEYEKEELIKEQEEKEQLRLATEAQSRRDDLHYAGIFIGLLILAIVIPLLGSRSRFFGRVRGGFLSPKVLEVIIFLSFLILFEFLLVLLDPFVEKYTGGAPIFKLILNAVLAGLIFPLHQFFEKKLKKKLVKGKSSPPFLGGVGGGIKALMFLGVVFLNSLLFAQSDTTASDQVAQSHQVANADNTNSDGFETHRYTKVDSLRHAYEAAEHDTTRINILFAMGEELILSNPDTTLIIEKKALEICKKNLDRKYDDKIFKKGMAEAYNNIGYIYSNQGEINKALEYYFLSLRLREEINDKKGLSEAYNNIGLIYSNQGEIEKALEHYFLCLKIDEEIKDKKGMASSYNNIGVIYYNQGKVEKVLEYFFLSLKIVEEIKDKKGMASSYNNIGIIYKNQEEFDKALEYFFLSLKIEEEIKNKKGMAVSHNNIGIIYEDQDEIEKALEYFILSLKIHEEIKHKRGIAVSYNNIGNALCNLDSLNEGMRYLEWGLKLNEELGNEAGVSSSTFLIGNWQLRLGQVEAALESGLEALAVAKEIGHVEYMKRAAGLLSKVYRKMATPPSPANAVSPPGGRERGGSWKKALQYYELEIQMRDSLINEENTKATIRQQMKYEHEKEQIIKEQQEKERSRQLQLAESRRNNLQHSAIFIGILILFGSVLMLGFVKVRPKDVEGIIFISFLILFEFVLVLADPHIEQYTGGAPGYKLLFNAGIAGLMFPLHQFFGGKLKKRIIKVQRKKIRERIVQFKKDVEEL